MLGTICYMFRQYGAILRQFINNKRTSNLTRTSGAVHPCESVLSRAKISACTVNKNVISVVYKLHLQKIKYCLLQNVTYRYEHVSVCLCMYVQSV